MTRRPPPSRRLALVVLAATAMLLVAAASTWYRATAPSDGTIAGYVTSAMSRDGIVVTTLPAAGTEAVLADGDRVEAIDGVPIEDALGGTRTDATAEAAVSDALPYLVTRDGRPQQLSVQLDRYPLGGVLLASWSTLLFCASLLGVSVFLFARRPAEPATAPLIVGASALVGSTIPWMLGLQPLDVARGTGLWIWLIGAIGVYGVFWSGCVHFLLVFPRPLRIVGRAPALVPLLYLGPLALVIGWAIVARAAMGSWLEALASLTGLQLALVLAASLTMVGLHLVQYRGTPDPARRQQVRWIAWASSVAVTATVTLWFLPELVFGAPILPWSAVGVVGLVVPVALAIAVLRHRLFDIDVVINRSLVYGGLTVVVLAVYAGAVAVLGQLLRGEGGFAVSLLATGAAALAALPVRDWLQRIVNRLMYGDRDDPYAAITRLGERLSASLTADEVLPTVVSTVATALRLPYVAIELGETATTVAASTGDGRGRELVRLPLVDQGERVGRLVVAPRSPGEGFSAADRRLLEGLAQEAGKAARSVRLAAEIDRSRRELVAAREEERRRLRRDLHDGLGPTIAGARLKVQAVQAMTSDRSDTAGSVLGELDAELAGMLEEVRRISRDLRPPALDELGLMPALRAQAAQLSADSGLDLRVEGPDELPALPAAVEAAAYRIALEAITNVRRHASAAHCAVRVRLGTDLELEVEDDGAGIGEGARAGVGLVSMRERASEVGGSCEVERRSDGTGTRVVAHLPLPAGSGA